MEKNVTNPGSGASWLVGGGRMGELVRRKDWSATPLGPIESWPESLRTTVNLALASNFPISIAWGPQRVQIYNDGYWPICGEKHPEAMGQDFKECWFSAWPAIGEAFESATAGRTAFLDNQRMFLDRNGYLEETFFTFSFSPIRDERGQVVGLFHPVTEMTEKTLAERRLGVLREISDQTAEAQTTEQAARAVVETVARHPLDVPFALLYLVEQDGRNARLAGSAHLNESAPIAPQRVALYGGDGDAWRIGTALRTGAAQQVSNLSSLFGPLSCGPYPESPETAIALPITASGRSLAVLVAGASPRRVFDSAYRTFFAMLQEAASNAMLNAQAYEEERKRAEALSELDRAKTIFFSNVSHEFRTPLTLMLGPLADVLEGQELSGSTRESLVAAHRNALRLLKLVNTLLDFSRIEAGRIQASFEPTDLAELTADLVSNFRSACDKAGIELVVDCPPLPQPVFVDRDMWEKIVLNLLSNAFKHTFEGRIEVSLCTTADTARLEVRDTGVGIPADELPRLFERFHRVETTGRTHEGTGIGLALVKELVQLHAGEVTVESEVGKGSVFAVAAPLGDRHLSADRIGAPRTLSTTASGAAPFVEEALRWLPESDGGEEAASSSPELSRPEPTAPAAAHLAAEAPPRILIADDNADMRDYLRHLLDARFRVQAVHDGVAGIEAARRAPPDLVIADVMMPRLDGLGLLRALRADRETASIPVILLSARAGEDAFVEGLAEGADDYMVKPFSARELLARVETHLDLARLRRANELVLRSVADTAPAMLWITNASGECTYLSRSWCEFTGQGEAEGLGRGWLAAVHPDDREAALQTFEQASIRREAFRVDYRIQSAADDGYRWAICSARPRLDPEGEFVGYVGAVTDVHDRALAEDALRESDRRKDEFLATLAHELRNPLAPLTTGLALLERDPGETAEACETREMMERQLQQIVRLIDDLLEVSRISQGKIELQLARTDLNTVIQQAVEAGGSALCAERRLEIDLPADPLILEADPVRLVQVFSNLLHNARKFTREGCRIQISAKVAPGEVAVTVADDGAGIPREELESIFELFAQIEGPRASREGGLGIGLTLVRRLTELHGGRVEAHSDGPGRGSAFTVHLPTAGPRLDEPEVSHAAHQRGPGQSLRILVVDDNVDAAVSVAALLRILGHETHTVHDGSAALAAAASIRPNTVLLDIGLPGMDGYEVARRLRETDWGRAAAIVAVTGWGQESDRLRSREAGFDAHVVKPVDARTLVPTLIDLVDQRNAASRHSGSGRARMRREL